MIFHRSIALALHIVADTPARRTLSVILTPFERVAHFNVDIIDAEPFFDTFREQWPVQFTSGKYMGMCCRIRLLAADILPGVDSVIVLDGGDQLLLSDIAKLWSLFESFKPRQYIGMAIERGRWYRNLAARHTAWTHTLPLTGAAKNMGFNAGMQLLNLTKMRAFNITPRLLNITHRLAPQNIPLFGHLGDQDVWNMFLQQEDVFSVPCMWNMQLLGSSSGYLAECAPIKMIHANAKAFKEKKKRRAHPFYHWKEFWKHIHVDIYFEPPLIKTPSEFFEDTLPS